MTSRVAAKLTNARQAFGVLRAAALSGVLGGNAAALSMLRSPGSALSYLQYSLFGWRLVRGNGLPQRQFHQAFDTPDHLSLDLLPTGEYVTWWDATYTKDILYLAMLARVISPKTVFGIGPLRGCTALLFALNTSPESVVHTLDLPPDGSEPPSLSTTLIDDDHIRQHARTSGYMYGCHNAGVKVKQLYGDSARFDFSPYFSRVDLFFIDGAHSYEYVRSDTMNALSCVRNGGVVVWHDYGRWGVNGVSRWLHELARSGKDVWRLPGSSLAILKL